MAESPSQRSPLASTFCDWASSDRALTVLEERIKAWHTAVTKHQPTQATLASKASHMTMVRLRRVHVDVGTTAICFHNLVLSPVVHLCLQ